MTLQDLATAVDLKLHIKIFILNNLFLGMVRQWQELFYEKPLRRDAAQRPAPTW